MLPPAARRFALTLHVVASVGWLGAIVVFLVLAVAAMAVTDGEQVRAAYVAMDLAGWTVLVPFALASFVSGVVQSLGTHWGLFRHYWVVVKLALTAVATVVLVLYTQTLGSLDSIARSDAALDVVRNPSPVLHAGAGLVMLLAATALAVYKPKGLTRRGWRRQQDLRLRRTS